MLRVSLKASFEGEHLHKKASTEGDQHYNDLARCKSTCLESSEMPLDTYRP